MTQTHMAGRGEGRRGVRGPGLAIGLAIAAIALVMLVIFLAVQPWESDTPGDPTTGPDNPAPTQIAPPNAPTQR